MSNITNNFYINKFVAPGAVIKFIFVYNRHTDLDVYIYIYAFIDVDI